MRALHFTGGKLFWRCAIPRPLAEGTTMLPRVDLFGMPVTRLTLGDNPFNGHSYIQHVHSGDEMKAFYTVDTCVRTLFVAQEQGINTCFGVFQEFKDQLSEDIGLARAVLGAGSVRSLDEAACAK